MKNNSKIKKIVFISGSRAEFFITKSLINETAKHFHTSVIMHAGNTQKNYGDLSSKVSSYPTNYDISKIISNFGQANNTNEILKIFSKQVSKIGKKLQLLNTRAVVLTGDRTETLATACAAMISLIPIIHIHGGELSQGSLDDRMRHAISKLSNFHFVTHDRYKKRLIQMGEQKKNIKVIGSPSLNNFDKIFFEANYLIKKYNIFPKKFILVTLNSYLDEKETKKISNILFKELDKFSILKVVTYPNPDLHNQHIVSCIKKRTKNNNYKFYKFLGEDYPFFMKYCKFMIGNSSSGIIEAPYFNTQVINLGSRQQGRLFSKNTTINLENNFNKLNSLINRCIKNKKDISSNNLYYKKKSSEMFVKSLKSININKINLKKFNDITND